MSLSVVRPSGAHQNEDYSDSFGDLGLPGKSGRAGRRLGGIKLVSTLLGGSGGGQIDLADDAFFATREHYRLNTTESQAMSNIEDFEGFET